MHNAVKIQDSNIPPYQVAQTFNISVSKYFGMKVRTSDSSAIISCCPDNRMKTTSLLFPQFSRASYLVFYGIYITRVCQVW